MEEKQSSSFWWFLAAAFALLGFVVYGQSIGNAFVRWDDGLLIYENPFIRGFTLQNLKSIFTSYDPELYIPLTFLSYQIDYAISGTHPAFYHFHSLLLHILNGILVVWVLDLLTKNRWIAVVTGLLFLVHPINTEAVAWASGRKDLLSGMFFLLSLGMYVVYWDRMHQSSLLRELRPTRKMRKIYVLSIVLFALGLLSKVTVITLPAVLLLIDWYRGRRFDRALWIEKIPYIILAILFGVIAYFGKTGVIDSSTTPEKLMIAPFSIVFYLQKLFVPTALAVIYPFTGVVKLLSMRILIPIAVCVALFASGLLSLKKTKTIFFCLAFFIITVSPSLLNFSKGDFLYFASDRYVYLPSIGILLLFAKTIWIVRIRHRWFSAGIICAILLTFAVLAYLQGRVWKDSESLFTNNVRYYPEAHSAHNNLGNIYRSKGNLEDAIDEYTIALSLSEEFGRGSSARYGKSKILTNLAAAQRANGNASLALETIQRALEIDPENPHVFLQRGISEAARGNISAAEEDYQKAIALDPGFTSAKINLGSLFVQSGRVQDAVDILESAIEQNPYYPQAYYNLAFAYKGVGRQHESMRAYEHAVDLEPSFVAARINLGIIYAERKRIDDAIAQFTEVLKYDPNNQKALSALDQLGASR